MAKITDVAQVSTKGSFNVLWGLVISTLIGSVGTIFIANLLGPDSYGLYTIVLNVPIIIQVFRDWGINYAIVRFIAQYRAQGRYDEIRSIYLTGILFELLVGLALSFFSFFSAGYIANDVFNRPVIAPLIQVISFSILAGGLVNAAAAIFNGYERLEFDSIMLIVQSLFKTSLMVGLIVVGFGTTGATIGYTAGTFIGGAIGLGLVAVISRQLPKPSSGKLEIKAYLTTMLTYCLPLSAATIITALLPYFYAFLLPIYYATNNVPIGNYGVAMNFVILISFFILPVSKMLFPAFSKLDIEKDQSSLKSIFVYSVKYGSLLVVPVTVLVMSLAEPAVATLFGNTYTLTAFFLSLLSIQYLYTAFGNLSITALLNGQGKTGFMLRMAVTTGLIGFPLGYILIMNFGVLGLIATTLVANVPSIIMGLFYVRKTFGATIDWASSIRIIISSAISGAITYFIVTALMFPAWIRLLLGVGLFTAVLVPALLLTRAVTRTDISNLKLMVGGLGSLGSLIGRLLSFLERLIVFLKIE